MWLEIPVITQLRVMVATGSRESLQQASELLAMLRQSAKAVHNTYQLIGVLALQCVALKKLGRADEALEVLQQAIKLAEPGGWVYPFTESGRPMAELLERLADRNGVSDYVRLVLDRFPTHEQATPWSCWPNDCRTRRLPPGCSFRPKRSKRI
jgi:tetratricopeptide (TPR) repeat protein